MKGLTYSFFICMLLLTSCGGLTRINVSMLEPGAVSFDPEITTVVLLNRALPPVSNEKHHQLEAILTGETKNQDKEGRQQVLDGLNASMMNSPRLKCVLATTEWVGSTSGTLFPPALSWDTIEQLCNQYQAQSIVALECFDSDCIITHETSQVQVNNTFGIPVPSFQIFVTQKIILKLGFRIYDFKNKKIIDQFTYSWYRNFNSQANSIGEIMTSVIDRHLAIDQTGYDAGVGMKPHISPTWNNESRSLYSRSGRSQMAIGCRQAMVGNWNDAMENWKQVLAAGPKRKIAGMAAYNMALACEVNGDLEGARNWISKSYGNFNNQQALYYQNTINRRYTQMMKLDQQMKQNP